MVKPLLLVALVANIFLLVTSSGAAYSSSSAVASSSSSSSSAAASSTQYQSSSGAAAAASSNSASSACTGLTPAPSCGPPQAYCRVNEMWSNCPVAVCSPKYCKDVGFPIACPDLGPNGQCPVKPGCICKQNYVKNHAGICVPMSHCPSCGGDKNAVIGCRDCNMLCSNYNKKPGMCAQGCVYNTCKCRLGFVYDEITRRCVFPSDCTRMICKEDNEVYDPCPPPCPFRTCGINDAAISCVPPLRPGDNNCAPPMCRCRNGYYRNDVGKCVLWEHCPVCRGLNEMYDPCPATCPPQECDVNIALILCLVPPKLGDPECKPGCRCIDDHVRNRTGVCIPRDQCPTCPNPNEVSDPCIAPCPPRRCDVDDRLIKCAAPPKLGDEDCVAGCRCADNYYRNSYGVCVTRAECPNCFGPHEIYACGGACDNVCATLHEQNQTNCLIKNVRCNDKCYCEKGYARDENDICIPIEKCKVPKCKGKHEVFCECIQGNCDPKTCSQVGFPVPCPRIDPKYCKKGCICEKGYVRDNNNVCIPTSQCPPTCGANEVYSDCMEDSCKPQNCSQLGFPIACPLEDRECCTKGCLCKEDYVRNSEGVCIPAKKCPSCGGDPHAESGGGNNCGKLCSNYFKEDVVCTLIYKINGCECRKGYVYDSNTKQCVLPKDCTPDCKINEMYSECINGGCTAKNCSQIGLSIPCVKLDYKACIKGCICNEGYLRETNGECVLEKDCKPKCNKPNEYYEPCDYGCPPNTCESLERAYVCPIREGDTCKGRCKCKENYWRNKIGECITEKQCRKCMGPNEYYSCKGPCDNVCADLQEKNQTNCPIKNKKCTEMCYCEKNYARARNGTCISIEDCKTDICDGKHEIYEDCSNPTCRPEKCSEVGLPLNCSDPPECIEGCVCKPDYVRNPKGICIPIKQCPSCGGDKHAESGSGVNCLKKCYDLQHPNHPRLCPKIYKFNACDCRKGYYYDENTKNCVKSGKCTPNCDTDEIPDTCINDGSHIKNCSQLGDPIKDIDPKKCQAGCSCKYGDLKSDDGKCIPVEKCPNAKCCKHEKFVICPDAICGPQRCDQLGYRIEDPIIEEGCCPGPPGCVCEDGYVRNDKEECIPKKHCPSCRGDPNAISGCDLDCEKNCEYLEGKKKKCPKKCKKNSCECRDGSYYDKNVDKCVTADCCSPSCGKDEVNDQCVNGGCGPRNCSQIDDPIICIDPKDCERGCTCKEGYLRVDATGVCVPKEKCPKICNKPNEVYVECPPSCPPQTCESINKTYHCPLIKTEKADCVGECRCKKGHYRNIIGECISKKNCFVNTTAALENFEFGNIKMTINFIKELFDTSQGKNFIFSAFSLLTTLAQPTIFAIDAAREQLLRVLNLENNEQILTVCPMKIKSLQGLQDIILKIANIYYANEKKCPVSDKFKEIADIFHSDAQNIDFDDSKSAAETVNEWVSDSTEGLIKDFATPDMFDSQTRIVMLNAIYFLGNWTYQFEVKKTKSKDFYLNDKDTIKLPTMTQINTFKYGESKELDAKAISLPYKGGECELTICLPNTKTGLIELLKKLDPDSLAKLKESLGYEKCNVSIPRMDIEFDFSDLKTALVKIGLGVLFDENSDDFIGMLKDNVPLFISKVKQKAVFKVNEFGTEAAAVTGVILSTRSQPLPSTVYTFNANHPFLFFLKCLDTTLFSGAFLK